MIATWGGTLKGWMSASLIGRFGSSVLGPLPLIFDAARRLVLPAGPHKIEITPVNANHQPVDRTIVVEFVIPAGGPAK
jgi:hypothetical protein